MSFDIGAMKTALASKISAAYVASGYSCNVYAYAPVDPITPCVIIDTGATEYHRTFGANGLAGQAISIEVRVPAGAAREVDALKECDRVKSTGSNESLFDAVSANNYALTDVSGWAFVLTESTAPEPRQAVDGSRFWYSITFTAELARSKG